MATRVYIDVVVVVEYHGGVWLCALTDSMKRRLIKGHACQCTSSHSEFVSIPSTLNVTSLWGFCLHVPPVPRRVVVMRTLYYPAARIHGTVRKLLVGTGRIGKGK